MTQVLPRHGVDMDRRVRMMASCAALSLIAAGFTVGGTAKAADTSSCDSFTTDLFQRVNPRTDANLLTRSAVEASSATRYGFTEDRGVLARVARSPEAGLTPIYRMYKDGDFVWAAEGEDASDLVDDGYSQQFVEFYGATNEVSCLEPIIRLQRDGMHRMAGAGDAAVLVQDGWRREATAFYAGSPDGREPTEPSPTATPRPTVSPTATPRPTTTPGTDTKFSLAVIPDTQNEVLTAGDSRMLNRSTWLAANKASLDLRYALQIGDLVNWGNVAPGQFTKASEAMKPLEASVPWAGAIGNHDTAAVCAGGSACPGADASATVRDTTAYNRAFPVARFKNVEGTYEPNRIDNAYATFSAGGVDWIALTLELWPRTGAVNWAKEVVRTHPEHNVIIVTHAYLESNGSISTSNGGYGATSPQYLYDNLVKVYPNIKIVVSGHTGQAAIRTDVGAGGNKILSLLQTYHSPNTNPVRLVEIDTAAGTVTSRVYAPLTGTSFPADSTSTGGLRFE